MKVIQEFKEFALKGNVVDLAVGLVIGTAFTAIVRSLVSDVIMPPIGYMFGGVDFSNLFYTLGEGEYETLVAAQEAGAATINYGMFINTIIAFILIAIVIFYAVKGINRMRREDEAPEDEAPTTKVCDFCKSSVPIEATRCPNCTSELALETNQ